MTTWNRFSEEVNRERQNIADYGGYENYTNRIRCGDSYKSQALRELAGRIYFQDKCKQSESENHNKIDQTEKFQCEIDILRGKLEADTYFLQSDGCLTQHEVERMKATLDRYCHRYMQHRDTCKQLAECESPAYWKAHDVVAAIANTIEMMSPQKEQYV